MQAKDAIRQTLEWSEKIMTSYVGDLEDADLMVRPTPGMNHIAWQLGHLIATERRTLEGIRPGSSPALPDDFEAGHSKEAATSDDPSKFPKKAEYLRLFQAQREATKSVLDRLSDADLDAPAPEPMRRMCPTIGSALNLAGIHVLMHVGQFVGVRRQRHKPVVI